MNISKNSGWPILYSDYGLVKQSFDLDQFIRLHPFKCHEQHFLQAQRLGLCNFTDFQDSTAVGLEGQDQLRSMGENVKGKGRLCQRNDSTTQSPLLFYP